MISIKEDFYRRCSAALFLTVLLYAQLTGFIVKLNSPYILYIFAAAYIFLNVMTFSGYYIIGKKSNCTALRRTALTMAIYSIVYYILSLCLNNIFPGKEIINLQIKYIPNYIEGIILIYFSFIIYKMRMINNKHSLAFSIIMLCNGILFCSFYFFILIGLTRVLLYGALCYYLFPKSET